MLGTPGNVVEGETFERLRRGLSPAQGPRAVDAMARTACFSRRQFHRLTVQLMGETPGRISGAFGWIGARGCS